MTANHISRRPMMLGLSALGANWMGGVAAAAAEAVETPDFEMLGVPGVNTGGHLAIAQKYGFFRDEGIAPKVRWVASTGDVQAIMAGGREHVATGGVETVVVLRAQNLPVKMIVDYCDAADSQGLVLRPGLKLTDPRQLEGKKLAFTPGTAPILILTGLAKRYRFDPAKVKIVNMGQPEAIVATGRGDVDGFLGFEPNLYRTVQLGGTMYATGATLYVGPKPEPLQGASRLFISGMGLLASEEWIRTKPKTLKALMRAVIRSNDFINQNRAAALEVMAAQLKLDPKVVEVSTRANVYKVGVGPEEHRAIDFSSDWNFSQHKIPRRVTPQEAFDTRLLAQINPKYVTV